MSNCFIYGDSNGIWVILQEQWFTYKHCGYTWYCECIVDKNKNLYLFDIKTSDINLYEIKESLLSLLHFFPGFTNFKVRVRQEARLETGETELIPIVMSMKEFVKALTNQNEYDYDSNTREYQHVNNNDTPAYNNLYPVSVKDVRDSCSQTDTNKNIKIII